MAKYLKLIILFLSFLICSCGDPVSARTCNRLAYCYRVDDGPRICDQDKSVADAKAKIEKDAGHKITVFKECWDF